MVSVTLSAIITRRLSLRRFVFQQYRQARIAGRLRFLLATGSPLPILARIFVLIPAALRICVLVIPLSANSF